MLGAIIGDVAAGTYEKDKNLFYSHLISEDVKPSSLGDYIETMGKQLISNPQISSREFECILNMSCIENPETMNLLRAIVIAWMYDSLEETYNKVQQLCLNLNKEDMDASHFLVKLIFALRTGSPKKREAQVEHVDTFRSFTKDKNWKCDSGILGTLVRAWMAFYDSFDFGSAMHNAMKLPGNRHLNAILVGALADAMYGCGIYLKKKKYGDSCVINHAKFVDAKIVEFYSTKRTFYPKNNACTNVERHVWTNVQTPYDNRKVSTELRRRILKAFSPDWDYRYGFYLDDGWVYIYRSFCLLFRFRLDKLDDTTWVLRNFQSSGENVDLGLISIEEAIYSIEHRWFLLSGENAPNNLEYCKYYHGEPEMPEQIKENKPISNFWYGEMMFVTNQQEMDSWKQDAANTLQDLNGEKREKFLSYSEEQRAILIYIETLFGKWCPYDNLEWIFEY